MCTLDDELASPPELHALYYGRGGDWTKTYLWQGAREQQAELKADGYNGAGGVQRNASHTNVARLVLAKGDAYNGATARHDASDPVDFAVEPRLGLITIFADLHSVVKHQRQYFLFFPLPQKKEHVDARLTFRSEATKGESGYSIQSSIINQTPAQAVHLELPTRQGKQGCSIPKGYAGNCWVIIKLPVSLKEFLRTHLWPTELPSARANYYQEQIDATAIKTDHRPVLGPEEITITSPRSLPSLKLTVPVWVPDEKEKR